MECVCLMDGLNILIWQESGRLVSLVPGEDAETSHQSHTPQ